MKINTIGSLTNLMALMSALKDCPNPISVDLETTGTDPFKHSIVGMGLCWGLDISSEACYVPLRHLYDQPFLAEEAMKFVRPVIEAHPWMAFNAAFELDFFRRQADCDIENLLRHVLDVQLMAHAYARYETVSLKNVCKVEFPEDETLKTDSFKEFMTAQNLSVTKNTIAEVPIPVVADYCVRDAFAAYKVYHKIYPLVKDMQIYKLEAKVLPVTVWMRANGVLLDKKAIKEEKERLTIELDYIRKVIESQITQMAGSHVEFNLDSPKQLGDVLYGRLKLPCDKFSAKTGQASTGAESLNKLKWRFPVVKNIISYKELKKRLSTYYDTYPAWTQEDGRIHASYNQTGVVTGRFSCSDPNLQNIPGKVSWDVESSGVKKTINSNLKSGFVVPEDCWFLEFDYNQIEARVAAGVTQDPVLLNAFNSGIDYHAKTASLVYSRPIESIKKDERQMGKKLNFALAYGMGAMKLYYELMKEMEISYEQAKIFRSKYLDAYPVMFQAASIISDNAQRDGFVKTIYGRRVPVFEFMWANVAKDSKEREGLINEGRRMGYNGVIQGTAADTLKFAMVKIYKLIKEKYNFEDVKLILSTHDSLSFQVKKAIDIIQFIKDIFDAMKMQLPKFPVFEAAVEIGTTWGNLKKIGDGETVEKFIERVVGGVTPVSGARKTFVVEFPEGQAKRTQGQILDLKKFIDSKPGENALIIKMGDKEKTYPEYTSVGIEDRERILLMVGGKFYERI